MQMNRKNIWVKPHIFTFYHIFSKAFFIMIFPFLQQIFLYPESILQKVNYTVFNILFIIILFLVIYLEYRQISYFQDRHLIICKKGLFHHTELYLPPKELTSISITRSFTLWLAGGCRVYLSSSTCCKTRKVELFTSNSYARKIVNFNTDKSAQCVLFKSRFIYATLMSLTESNALTGTLAISVIINRLSTILGEQLTNSVIKQLQQIPNIILSGLPPTLAYIAGFIFIGFLFGIIKQIFENACFTSFYNQRFLFIYKGLLRKSILCVNRKKLNGILIKQTLLMYIAKIYTLAVLYTGFKETKSSGVYIPLTFGNKLKDYISPFVPIEEFSDRLIPPKDSLKSYLYAPLVYITILILLCVIFYSRFETSFIARFTALVLTPFGVLWLWFRFIAGKHCKVCISTNTIKINYYRHLNLRIALVNKNTVSKIVISQNIFQRFFNKCHMTLYLCNKKSVPIKVKHLNYTETLNFIKNLS